MCSFLPEQRGLIEKLVIQVPKRPAHLRTGKMTKRSCSVTILPGVENLHLTSVGGGSRIRRPRLLRKTAPLVSLTLVRTVDVIPRKPQRCDQHGF
jgi:hypothetical protein